MDSYFNQLDGIVINHTLSNGTRTQIKSVINLRKNQWKPIQEEAHPIPKEAVHEHEETRVIPKKEYVIDHEENQLIQKEAANEHGETGETQPFPNEAVHEHEEAHLNPKKEYVIDYEENQLIPNEVVCEYEEQELDHHPTNPESEDSMGERARHQTTPQLDRDDYDGIKLNDNCYQGKQYIKPNGGTSTGDNSSLKNSVKNQDCRNYDDNLQLFVGNIPYYTTEQELMVRFKKISY